MDRRLTKREREERNRIARERLEKGGRRKIIIDCSFNHIMTHFERASLVVQIQQCYSNLRRVGVQDTRMMVVSCDDSLRAKIKKQGGEQWVVDLSSDPLERLIGELGEHVIVMSPDASDELTVAEVNREDSVFVIGGIVDRLVSRNETSHKALKLGLKSRRLPLDADKFINKVFNIDSVFEFLIKARNVQSRDDMINVLLGVLPERKRRDTIEAIPKVKNAQDPQPDPCNTIKLDRYSIENLFL